MAALCKKGVIYIEPAIEKPQHTRSIGVLRPFFHNNKAQNPYLQTRVFYLI